MNLMSLERLPDAIRTVKRLLWCFAPALILMLTILPGRPDQLWRARDLYDGIANIHATFLLALFLCSTYAFSMWQSVARNPLANTALRPWLALHGWNGEPDKLIHRGLLPLSELICLIFVTAACSWLQMAAIVLVPMAWSLGRLQSSCARSFGRHPYKVGVIFILHATAFWQMENLWLAVPLVLAAVVLTEQLIGQSLRTLADELVMQDLPSTRQSNPFLQSEVLKTRPIRPFPFAELSPDVQDKRPPLSLALWLSFVPAWICLCATYRLAEFDRSVEFRFGEVTTWQTVGGLLVMVHLGVCLLWRVVVYRPIVWIPRLSPLSRLRLARPIVWSWDRAWLPVLINLAALILLLGNLQHLFPGALSIFLFAQSMLLLRCGPPTDEWQTTADARLTAFLLPSTPPSSARRG